MPLSRTAAVVLAAGEARRFGALKQVAEVDGRPLVAWAVGAALEAGVGEVVVVVGRDAARVVSALPDDGRVRTVDNPAFASGQASSVRAGVAALGEEVDAAVVLLADQPGVTSAAIRAVIDALAHGAVVARARYDDHAGHPVAFARPALARLASLSGDAGARQLWGDLEVTDVPIPGPSPPDVDTPADLDAL